MSTLNTHKRIAVSPFSLRLPTPLSTIERKSIPAPQQKTIWNKSLVIEPRSLQDPLLFFPESLLLLLLPANRSSEQRPNHPLNLRSALPLAETATSWFGHFRFRFLCAAVLFGKFATKTEEGAASSKNNRLLFKS